MGRRRKDQTAQDSLPVEDVVPESVDLLETIDADVFAGDVAALEGAPAFDDAAIEEGIQALMAAATKWRVLEDQTVSLFGHMTLLPAGTLVSAASYGPAGIKRIMEQGVKLAPVG